MFLRKIIRHLNSIIRSIFFKIFIGHSGKKIYLERCTFYRPTSIKSTKKAFNLGNNVSILKKCELTATDECPITIGDNTFINSNCIIRPNVHISNNVSIGMNCKFITDTHEIGPRGSRAGKSYFTKIEIEDGCWIGADVTIIGDCLIKKGTIIGAGSVIKGLCESDSIYYGSKAKKIKEIK